MSTATWKIVDADSRDVALYAPGRGYDPESQARACAEIWNELPAEECYPWKLPFRPEAIDEPDERSA